MHFIILGEIKFYDQFNECSAIWGFVTAAAMLVMQIKTNIAVVMAELGSFGWPTQSNSFSAKLQYHHIAWRRQFLVTHQCCQSNHGLMASVSIMHDVSLHFGGAIKHHDFNLTSSSLCVHEQCHELLNSMQ